MIEASGLGGPLLLFLAGAFGWVLRGAEVAHLKERLRAANRQMREIQEEFGTNA